MERWRAAQSLGPDERPGAVFMTVTAGEFAGTNTEWLGARVVARPAGRQTYDPNAWKTESKQLSCSCKISSKHCAESAMLKIFAANWSEGEGEMKTAMRTKARARFL